MNAIEIAKALGRTEDPAKIMELVQACHPRRLEIKDRLIAIAYGYVNPPARAKAILAGPDAVAALDAEMASLDREHSYLNDLERACFAAHEKAINAALLREIPLARKRLPGAMDQFRKAYSGLQTALAELNRQVLALSEYERLEDPKLPIDDRTLAELIRLRDLLASQTQPLHVVIPPSEQEFPSSWALFYETVNVYGAPTTRRRHYGPGPNLSDIQRGIAPTPWVERETPVTDDVDR